MYGVLSTVPSAFKNSVARPVTAPSLRINELAVSDQSFVCAAAEIFNASVMP